MFSEPAGLTRKLRLRRELSGRGPAGPGLYNCELSELPGVLQPTIPSILLILAFPKVGQK
jgi:hypothetical protein